MKDYHTGFPVILGFELADSTGKIVQTIDYEIGKLSYFASPVPTDLDRFIDKGYGTPAAGLGPDGFPTGKAGWLSTGSGFFSAAGSKVPLKLQENPEGIKNIQAKIVTAKRIQQAAEEIARRQAQAKEEREEERTKREDARVALEQQQSIQGTPLMIDYYGDGMIKISDSPKERKGDLILFDLWLQNIMNPNYTKYYLAINCKNATASLTPVDMLPATTPFTPIDPKKAGTHTYDMYKKYCR